MSEFRIPVFVTGVFLFLLGNILAYYATELPAVARSKESWLLILAGSCVFVGLSLMALVPCLL